MTKDGKLTTYAYNALNQITRAGDINYTWDNAGNLVSQTTTTGVLVASYTYDSQNRMISATVSTSGSNLIETYEYDYLGNRTAKISGGVRTEYTTDLSTGYSQVLKATTGSDTVYYTRGFELISRRTGSAAFYYIYDGCLSVRALTNEAGTVTDTLVFDAFGNETTKTGSTDNSYGFQGEEKDETGLYYLRARYMDPSTGTFTSMDTYGGSLSDPMSLHKYMFANSNPVTYSDPSGHVTVGELMMSTAIMTIISTAASAVLAGLEYEKTCGYTPDIGDAKQWVSIGLGALKGFIIGGFSFLSLFMVYALAFTAVECLMVAGLCAVVGGILGDDAEFNRRNGNTAWAWAEETLSDGFISAGVCIALAGLSGGGETYDSDYAIRNKESSGVNETINPQKVKYMQSSIKNQTGNHTVIGNAKALKNGTLKPSDLPEIRIWKDCDGNLWTLDHRRLASYKLAGVEEVPFRWASDEEVRKEIWKMTTTTGGESIKLKFGNGKSIII